MYVDSRVGLTGDPQGLWASLIGPTPSADIWFGAFHHSERATVLDEFAEVLTHGFDAAAVLHEQLAAYALTDPDGLARRARRAVRRSLRRMRPFGHERSRR